MKQRNLRPVLAMQPLALDALDVLAPPYEPATATTWGELDALLAGAPPATVLVLDPYAGERPGELFPKVRDVLRRFPSLAVVAALELKRENVADVATLLDWGVSEVIDLAAERTPRAVQARLRQAHARPLKRRLEGALSSYVAPEARALLMAASEVAVEGGGAPELARRLSLSPRTLTERCARADLPPPRQLQAWMRILLACALLDDPGRTVYSAADACGYSTDRSLRRAVGTFLGADTTALRRQGAFTAAAKAFNAALREVREAGRERRKVARPVSSGEEFPGLLR